MTRPALLWGPPVVWMAAIFGVSSMSDISGLPGQVSPPAAHFGEYAVLALLLVRAFAGGRLAGVTWRTLAAAVVVSTAYGVSDEWHQSFVPGRAAELTDVVMDAAGATAAAGAAWAWSIINRFSRSRREPDGVHQPSSRA
jgi:hypothetical protein